MKLKGVRDYNYVSKSSIGFPFWIVSRNGKNSEETLICTLTQAASTLFERMVPFLSMLSHINKRHHLQS